MNVNIASRVEDDCHVIEVLGSIVDFEEYKQLTKRYNNEIVQYGKKKMIIDASRIELPAGLLMHSDLINYVKKPECPVLCTGMNGPRGFGGMCPQFNLAFSLEEAPTFGRGSSLL